MLYTHNMVVCAQCDVVFTSLPVNRQGLTGGRSLLEGREEKCFSASFTTSS